MKKKFSQVKKTIKKASGRVVFIRHGATDFNNTNKSEDRIRGWIDVPLNDEGRRDAEKAAKDSEKYKPVAGMYSSDLIRAKETAQIVNKVLNVPAIVFSSDLRPWNLGDYQGKITADILDELNYMVKNENAVPNNGESFKHFRIRYLSLVDKVIKEALTKGTTLFIVSHFRNLKAVDSWKEKGFPKDFSIDTDTMIKDAFKTGEVYELDLKNYKGL